MADTNETLETPEDDQAVEGADAPMAQDDAATSVAIEEPAADESATEAAASGEAGGTPEASTPEAADAAPEANLPARDADGFSNALGETEGLQRKHIPGGIGYEVIYVVRSGDQSLVDESSQRVRELIEGPCEGAIDNVRASEVRRFAYPIKKQTEGVYVVVNARFKPEHTNELDRFFKLEENVLRHMMLKEDN